MVLLDIEMPENCRECPLRETGRGLYPHHYCMAKDGRDLGSMYDFSLKRQKWCPLKEVEK